MSKYDVFISHSSSDKESTVRLSVDLKAVGAKVQLDETELKIGDSLFNSLSIALEDCTWKIVVFSKTSISSEWVKKEIATTLSRKIFEKRILLLPLLLDDCNIPALLKVKLYADFRGCYNFGLEKLLATIESTLQNIYNLRTSTLKAGLLPAVYNGLKLKANYLARIQYAINLVESLLGMEITLFNPFRDGQILTAESLLNETYKYSQKKMGLPTECQNWPVFNGQRQTAEILNEILASVNELIQKLINTR